MKTVVLMLAMVAGAYGGRIQAQKNSVSDVEKPGGSSLITDWMKIHFDAILNAKVKSQQFRPLAYMGVALYESIVPGDPAYKSLAGQLNEYSPVLHTPENPDVYWPASANAALAQTMRFFYNDNPLTVQRIDSMEQACRMKFISQGKNAAAIDHGAAYGKQVADNVIAWCRTDLADHVNDAYTLPVGDGLYELTSADIKAPVSPHMGKCRTMVKGSCDSTMPPPPTAFSPEKGSGFYNMVNDLYTGTQNNSPSQIATALFWDDFPNGKTLTAGGHWESILGNVMKQKNMSLIEGARVYSELFITMQDAVIGCFKAKYTYNLLRPVTYIHKYMNHTDWQPLITTPMHPEYPAAHATVSMSAAVILTHILGNDVSFTDNAYDYRHYPAHHFNNFIEAGTEAGLSRFYGGIHYRPSITAGFAQGKKIADHIGERLEYKPR
jgi:hypothetical protein